VERQREGAATVVYRHARPHRNRSDLGLQTEVVKNTSRARVIRIVVLGDQLEIEAVPGEWRRRADNTISVAPERDRRVVWDVGGSGGARRPANTLTTTTRVFDVVGFDASLADAATRFWHGYAAKHAFRGYSLVEYLRRSVIVLEWPAWTALSMGQREEYLGSVARYSDLVVNGRAAATWPWRRRLLRRPPTVVP